MPGDIKTLLRSGIKVLQDISGVGFGDDQTSMMAEPTLTTVSQPSCEMGENSADLLIRRITRPRHDPPVTEILSTTPAIRELPKPN